MSHFVERGPCRARCVRLISAVVSANQPHCRIIPPVTWRQRVGDIPQPGDTNSCRRGRSTFTVAGPRRECFSTYEYVPNADGCRPRSASCSGDNLHKFPFRAPSPNPQAFGSVSAKNQLSRSASASSRPYVDHEMSQRVSSKGPAPPRDVQVLWKNVEKAVSAQLDQVQAPPQPSVIMRRVPREGLRAKYIDKGRQSTAPARGPLQRS